MSILDKQYKYVHVDLVTTSYSDMDITFSASDEETSDFYVVVTRLGKKINLKDKIIILYVYKPDGTSVNIEVPYMESLNAVYCNLPYAFKDAIGKYEAQLYIEETETNKKVMSSTFHYKVNRDILYNLNHPEVDKPNTGGSSGGGTNVPTTPLTITFSSTPTVVELYVPTQVTLSWSYSDRISGQTINGNLVSKDVRSVTETISTRTTYTLSAIKEGTTTNTSKTITINAVGASYYGIINTLNPTETDIKNLTKNVKTNKSLTYTGINLQNSKVCYAYPSSFGALNSIKDANGFEYLDSYTVKTMTINNIGYYVYILTDSTTIDNLKQTFN